jgi:hypothetical protein
MRFSQADLASLLDVSRAAVSQATTREYKCAGYPVSAWAIYDGAGRVAGYDVPDHIVQQRMPEEPEPTPKGKLAQNEQAKLSRSDLLEAAEPLMNEERIREIIRSEVLRQNPRPERRQDYMRPAAAGGLSYVMARAVDGDSATARAAVLSAATLFGGLIGSEASDHWAGALVGAALVGAVGWKALQTGAKAQESAKGQEPEPSGLEAPPDPVFESQPMQRGDGISTVAHTAA